MSFILRHNGQDYKLRAGRFSIGRSEQSDLCVDDPLASREHAFILIEGREISIHDMQSRNGVFVNQERIKGQRLLQVGDVIRIGSQEMSLAALPPGKTVTLVQAPITQNLQAFGVLGTLADKAIAMGNGGEAERIIGRQLEHLLAQAGKGELLKEEMFHKTASYALRIAGLTKKPKWLEFLFKIHAEHTRLMDAEMVNELYALSRRTHGVSRSHLRSYLSILRDSGTVTNPSEKFVLGRLEGLEALLN